MFQSFQHYIILIPKKFNKLQMEKNIWSPYQDNILKFLRQERKLQRWTEIARALVDQYKIKGKNGKNCKQRYQERFDYTAKSSIWSFSEEKRLFTLHNQLGNKWAIISRKMTGRTDNCIKNHFYSRLRKGLKKMNQIAQQTIGKSFKEIKFTVIFKIIEATEDGFKDNRFCQKDTSNHCFDLKNQLIALSYEEDEQHDYSPEEIDCVQIYQNINAFSKTYKRKPKKFRRIPTKSEEKNQRQFEYTNSQKQQNQQNEESSQQSLSQEESLQQINKCEKKYESGFQEFKQENYKVSELKTLKKRRESAQTVGIQAALVGSGILEEEPNLPLLNMTRKRTSYFDLLSEQSQKQNMFFDQLQLKTQNFFLNGLMSMKRLSVTDQRLFE